MRRIRTDNTLSAVPANGYVEVFQARKNASIDAAPQGLALSTLIAEAVSEGGLTFDTFAELDALVADESLVNLSMLDTPLELANLLNNNVMVPGSGWNGVGSYASSIEVVGDIVKTTIYVDLTGAKSSTTEDDVIGFDKGADIVVNGTFTGDTNWTKGATWVYAANTMTAIPGAGSNLTPAVPLVATIGKTYELTYTMSAFVAGTSTASFGGVAFTPRGSDATFVQRIVAVSTAGLSFAASTLANFTIDAVSLKEVKLAHLGQFTVAENGTLFDGEITWLETPVTGLTDIDFWAAPEASGAFDDPGKTDLTEVAVYAKGSAAAAARQTPISLTALPAADSYLYMFGGTSGTVGTYSAGIFKMIFWGAKPG